MAAARPTSTELVSLMFAIGRFMREGGKKKKVHGISCSLLQFETLRYVKDHERPLMRDVASHFNVTPPAATLLIDGLVREKLLARVVDAKDRRAIRIALTRTGKALLLRGMKEKIARFNQIFRMLTDAEREDLAKLLRKMAKSVT